MANKKNEPKKVNKGKISNAVASKKNTTAKKEVIKEKKVTSKETVAEKTVVKEKPIKKNHSKNKNLMKFFDFFDKYRLTIYGFIGGVLLTILIVILIWPDRIATLSDGTQPVAEVNGEKITADKLYEDMKGVYSISLLLDDVDNKILEEKYPVTDEMNEDLDEEANNYYKMYEQYYQQDKQTFLSSNGFGSETAFIEYLRLNYRRSKYAEEYVKSLVTDNEAQKYYEDKVYGDINTKHILVKVDSAATEEEKKTAKSKAEEIITKLNDGKTFDEVKEEYKDEITYEELGYKSYNASLESAYMTEMQKLENSSYSKTPVETSYGYHIVYRIDQKEKPIFEDVKDEIIGTLATEKSTNDKNLNYIALDKMRTDAGFKFYDTVLEGKYNTYMAQYK